MEIIYREQTKNQAREKFNEKIKKSINELKFKDPISDVIGL
jgi:hypothetical protein